MCGLVGFIDFSKESNEHILQDMVSTMNHRGPDSCGIELIEHQIATIGLAHSRLSILDLSSAGSQPMSYKDYFIVFNGEIYNYKELKQELLKRGHHFNSDSDTEVILHSFEEWGFDCVDNFIGMFVFVIYNKKNNQLIIVRDRAGVKPLFYYWNKGIFMFASELKAFHKHKKFEKIINFDALNQYFSFGYIAAPYCIFENCKKLEPGQILVFNLELKKFEISTYWNIAKFYEAPKSNIPYIEARDNLEKLLINSFKYRLVSDVPVGIFLSGGYDSTAVSAILQSNSSNRLKTFTIGFESGLDESKHAKKVASYLGTDHYEYICRREDIENILPSLPFYFDEPFADSSAIPTILVSRFAKQTVDVALSADGGDEIFAGYSSYNSFLRDIKRFNKVPQNIKGVLKQIINLSLNSLPKYSLLRRKLNLIYSLLNTENSRIYQKLLSQYPLVSINPNLKEELIASEFKYLYTSYDNDFSKFQDPLSVALAIDFSMYLQNDILVKIDRATMSASLEGREPFLDHRIIEYVAMLPTAFKFNGTQKYILKDIVHKYVPPELMNRPKMGFTLEIFPMLRNELSFLIHDTLSKKNISDMGFFNEKLINSIIKKFLKGNLYDDSLIWRLIQFRLWYSKWM